MSAIVDFAYYTGTYMGTEANEASFPALYAHASRVIGAMTRWQVTEENFATFPAFVQTLYRLAICSQVDFLSINGVESLNTTGGVGFTVGKVRVDGYASARTGGALSASVSPAAVAYLEQTGLLYPAVPVVGVPLC